MTTHELYQAALAADNAWQAELQRLFGRNAGDVRYTEQGSAGPILAPLYAEFKRTSAAWRSAVYGTCADCDGNGWIEAYGEGDQAGGYADTCQECKGTGKAKP